MNDLTKSRDAESAILAAKNLPTKGSIFDHTTTDEIATLQFNIGYTTLSAHFSHVKREGDGVKLGDVIKVRTFFWRAENEICAIVPAAEARAFYRRLKDAGFVEAEKAAS